MANKYMKNTTLKIKEIHKNNEMSLSIDKNVKD